MDKPMFLDGFRPGTVVSTVHALGSCGGERQVYWQGGPDAKAGDTQ